MSVTQEWRNPYPYQKRLFDKVKNQNGIVVLPTGHGKTFVASLVIHHFLQEIKRLEDIAVFLCNTRVLAEQQYKYVTEDLQNIPPEFGECGEVHVKLLTGESLRVDGIPMEEGDLPDGTVLRDWAHPDEWKVICYTTKLVLHIDKIVLISNFTLCLNTYVHYRLIFFLRSGFLTPE